MAWRKHRSRADRHHPQSRLAISAVTACVAALIVSGAATQRVDASSRAPITQVGTLEVDQTGVTAPAGVAFKPASKTFHLLQSVGQASASGGETEVADVDAAHSVSGRKGTDSIAARVSDPINVAFDADGSRLLLISQTRDLVEVGVSANGRLVPGSLVRHNLGRLELVRPRGLAVDPATGAVFVLDAARPRIVRLAAAPNGAFETATATQIDLQGKGFGDVRGLAFDAVSRHLFLRAGSTLYELTSTGDLVSTRDLSGLELSDPQGMVFAPSGDQTDAAATQSLYVADTGTASGGTGQIAELSLQAQVAAAASNFASTVVRVTDASQWSPPSPDASGVTYVPATQRLVISDSEVEEIVQGITHFQGANVWETDLSGNVLRSANVSTVAPTNVPMTSEPAGVAWDPGNGHYFFVSDAPPVVYDLNPGGDGLIGTADDTWTSFSTNNPPPNNDHGEGITYDTTNGHLFVSDGPNQEIYEYTKAGALLNHFDVAQYGVGDPESVEYNAASDTLFTLSNRQSGPIVVETTTSGALVQTIDVSAMTAVGVKKPAGLAYAPASDGSGVMHFYVVDRGKDNNADPNIIDGKLVELTAPSSGNTNNAPIVGAGTAQTITLPAQASLSGTVSDDGLPNPPGAVTTTWSMTSGPGTVTFVDPSAVNTTASFSTSGVYVLRLTASDSQLSSFNEVTITVNPATGGDLIFADGFESGSFSAWSSATTGGGDLTVSSAGAQSGTQGMQATINSAPLYVTDASPAAELRYRARFWFNPNRIVMAGGDTHTIFDALNASGTTVLRIELRFSSHKYQVRAGAAKDGAGFPYTAWFTVANGWHAIELDWRASSGPGANSGRLTLWIDGVQSADMTAVDNATRRVESARLGAVDGIDAGTNGTEYFDTFESHRQNYIGP